jgi:hypothetical protein
MHEEFKIAAVDFLNGLGEIRGRLVIDFDLHGKGSISMHLSTFRKKSAGVRVCETRLII